MLTSLKTAFFLAVKDIWHHRRMIVLVLAALAFSFVNILFVSSIINGFSITFQKQVTNLNGQIIISPKEKKHFIDNVKETKKRIASIEEVDGVTHHLISAVSTSYGNKEVGTLSQGIPVNSVKDVSILPRTVIEGRYLKSGDKGKVLLGNDLADLLKKGDSDNKRVAVGQKITVAFPNGIKKTLKVVGLLDTKSFNYNENLFVPEQEITSVLKADGKASEIYVKLKKDADINKVVKKIRRLDIDGEVKTWEDRAGFIKDMMKAIGILEQILSGIGLIITAIIVTVIIYINTQNKRRQIGILKAIGGQRSVILLTFLMQATIFALIGIVFGGLIFSGMNAYLQQKPIQMPFGPLVPNVQGRVVLTYVLSFIAITLAAALYPALKASREIIVKVIWGE